MRRELVLGSWRELGVVGLVAALCGAYAAALIMTAAVLSAAAGSGGDHVGILLGSVATVFILIAVYISAVVITNGVDTVLAGRLPEIALLRLLGARSRSLRSAVTRGTALTAAVGVLVGTTVGAVAADVLRVVLVSRGKLPDVGYPVVTPMLLTTVALTVAAAAGAGWAGSRAVLRVSPAQALAQSASAQPVPRRTSRVRGAIGLLMIGGGALLLVLGARLGESGSAAGFLTAFLGSAISGTGFLVGARLVIPRLVAIVSRAVGRGPASRIAGRNAVKDPLRTTRSTMGLVVGVALVTTFVSGLRALSLSVSSWDLSGAERVQAHQLLSTATAVMVAIVVISAVISAVGFVSTMSLTVIARRREIGLLRSLGFTRDQVRQMITFESAALSGTAVGLGLVLGLVYGSLGAQSLIGSLTDGFVLGLPWAYLGVIAGASVLLVLLAARPPARRAIRVTPIEAMRLS